MIPSFRWFGPTDLVTLKHIRQAGVHGVITALHDHRCGDLWSREAIAAHRQLVEAAGMKWHVVESLPVHESIKQGSAERDTYITRYIESLRNLAAEGMDVICYNFMLVTDMTRTQFAHPLEDGSTVLLCDGAALAAFEKHVLELDQLETRYSSEELAAGDLLWSELDAAKREELTSTVLLGLPGTVDDLTPDGFKEHLTAYDGIDADKLRENLVYFLNAVTPVAEEVGIKMAIHPDDPPRPLYGLPRILSTGDDFQAIVDAVPSKANGLTFCSGSFGGRLDNNPVDIFRRFADRIPFAHFRNVRFLNESTNTFCESPHLDGRVDMIELVSALVDEEARRAAAGHECPKIPVRPDHGRELIDDARKSSYAGYSYQGRAIALAELLAVEMTLTR